MENIANIYAQYLSISSHFKLEPTIYFYHMFVLEAIVLECLLAVFNFQTFEPQDKWTYVIKKKTRP